MNLSKDLFLFNEQVVKKTNSPYHILIQHLHAQLGEDLHQLHNSLTNLCLASLEHGVPPEMVVDVHPLVEALSLHCTAYTENLHKELLAQTG